MLFTREPLFNDAAELITAVLTVADIFMAVLAFPLAILLHRSHRHALLVTASRVDPRAHALRESGQSCNAHRPHQRTPTPGHCAHCPHPSQSPVPPSGFTSTDATASVRCGRYPQPFQHPPHRGGPDPEAQAEQLALDPFVAPA